MHIWNVWPLFSFIADFSPQRLEVSFILDTRCAPAFKGKSVTGSILNYRPHERVRPHLSWMTRRREEGRGYWGQSAASWRAFPSKQRGGRGMRNNGGTSPSIFVLGCLAAGGAGLSCRGGGGGAGLSCLQVAGRVHLHLERCHLRPPSNTTPQVIHKQ